MSSFESPAELATYVRETAEIMAGLGMSTSRVVDDVSRLVCTTSSEWLGAIGAEVRSIEATCDVPTDVQQRFDRIMEAVHVAWPTL